MSTALNTTIEALEPDRIAELDEALDEVARLIGDERQRVELAGLQAISLHFMSHRPDDALRVLHDAIASLTDTSLWPQLALREAQVLNARGRCAAALAITGRIISSDDATATTAVRAQAQHSLALSATGRTEEAIHQALVGFDRLEHYRRDTPLLVTTLLVAGANAASYAGDLAAADRFEAAAARELAQAPNLASARRCQWAGIAALRLRGRTGEALRRSRELLRSPAPVDARAIYYAELAHAAAICGDAKEAVAALAAAEAHRTAALRLCQSTIDLAAPWVHASTGDLDRAIDVALDAARQARSDGLLGLELLLSHNAVRLGAAAKVAARLAEIATIHDGDLAPLCAAHARASATNDGDALEAVSVRFERLGLMVCAADAAAQAVQVHMSHRHDSAKQRALRRARYLLTRCDRVRTPALMSLHTADLTPREQSIVQLAASGLTSKQMAQRLVLSTRTIENHLQSAYSKLGIRSRSELASLVKR